MTHRSKEMLLQVSHSCAALESIYATVILSACTHVSGLIWSRPENHDSLWCIQERAHCTGTKAFLSCLQHQLPRTNPTHKLTRHTHIHNPSEVHNHLPCIHTYTSSLRCHIYRTMQQSVGTSNACPARKSIQVPALAGVVYVYTVPTASNHWG